jgi:hypothetical protein
MRLVHRNVAKPVLKQGPALARALTPG